MAAVVRAELQQLSSGDVESTEDCIISRFKSLMISQENSYKEKSTENMQNTLNNLIEELGAGVALLVVRGNNISCCFICTSEQQLKQLHRHYVYSGRMKNVLEKVFTILTGNDEPVVIRKLQWSFEEYRESVRRFELLRALGWLSSVCKLAHNLTF